MKKQFVFLMLMAVVSVGCNAAVRKDAINLSREDVANVETLREISRNLLKTWPIYAGMINGAMDTKKLPQEAVDAMIELRELAGKKDTLSDFDLGRNLGLQIRVRAETVKLALRMLAPGLMETLIGMGF